MTGILLARESLPRRSIEVKQLECKRCLTPDSLVVTEYGVKKIKDIKVGERVLTHEGRYRPVTQVFTRQYEDNILEFSVQGINLTTQLTTEHPVLVRQMTRSSSINGGALFLKTFDWISSEQLYQESQRKLVSKRHRKQHVTVYPRISEIVDLDTLAFIVTYFRVKRTIEITVDLNFMKCVGYWLAEGTVLRSPARGVHGIRYFFGKDQKEYYYARDVTDSLVKLGFRPDLRNYRGLWQVTVTDAKLGRLFEKQFGSGAANKHIPLWIKKLPAEKLGVLLYSYILGDGHILKKDAKWVVSTISQKLAFDIRDVALKVGRSCRVHKCEKGPFEQILGRIVKVHSKYAVFIYDRERVAKNSLRADAKYLYRRVRTIQRRPYKGIVCNLEVYEDNSYCTPLFAVHNCGNRWHPRIIDGTVKIPETCPNKNCRSPYWQTPRKKETD